MGLRIILIFGFLCIFCVNVIASSSGRDICWDSKWFNTSVPFRNGSSYEHQPADVLNKICKYGSVTAAMCKDDKGEPFMGTFNKTYFGFVAVCNHVDGLICNPVTHSQYAHCPDYAIRYGCDCAPPPTTTTAAATVTNPLRLEDVIDVRCSDSNWNITVDMSRLKMMYPSVKPTDIFFGAGKCRGQLDTNFLQFTQSFNSCSTTEKFNADLNIYKNNLYYIVFDPIRPYVVLKHEWTFMVECDVNTNEVTSSHVDHLPEIHNASFSSHYHLSMSYFSDVNFFHRISGNPLLVNLGDNIFVKVYTTLPDWDTKMILDTCYTRPSIQNTTTMDITLIQDGCELDKNTHIISQSTHETRFVYKDFKYFNNNDGGLDIYCNATFCHTSDFSTRCTQTCTHTMT